MHAKLRLWQLVVVVAFALIGIGIYYYYYYNVLEGKIASGITLRGSHSQIGGGADNVVSAEGFKMMIDHISELERTIRVLLLTGIIAFVGLIFAFWWAVVRSELAATKAARKQQADIFEKVGQLLEKKPPEAISAEKIATAVHKQLPTAEILAAPMLSKLGKVESALPEVVRSSIVLALFGESRGGRSGSVGGQQPLPDLLGKIDGAASRLENINSNLIKVDQSVINVTSAVRKSEEVVSILSDCRLSITDTGAKLNTFNKWVEELKQVPKLQKRIEELDRENALLQVKLRSSDQMVQSADERSHVIGQKNSNLKTELDTANFQLKTSKDENATMMTNLTEARETAQQEGQRAARAEIMLEDEKGARSRIASELEIANADLLAMAAQKLELERQKDEEERANVEIVAAHTATIQERDRVVKELSEASSNLALLETRIKELQTIVDRYWASTYPSIFYAGGVLSEWQPQIEKAVYSGDKNAKVLRGLLGAIAAIDSTGRGGILLPILSEVSLALSAWRSAEGDSISRVRDVLSEWANAFNGHEKDRYSLWVPLIGSAVNFKQMHCPAGKTVVSEVVSWMVRGPDGTFSQAFVR